MFTLLAKSIVVLVLGSLFLMAFVIGYAGDALTAKRLTSPGTDRFRPELRSHRPVVTSVDAEEMPS